MSITGINSEGKVITVNGDEWEKSQERNEETNAPKAFKSKQLRTRRFCISSYIDRASLETYVSTLPWVQHWSMITHDKDLEKDGTPKKVHTHVLLYTYEAKTSSAIKKKFDNFSKELYRDTDTKPQNTNVQICHDMPSQWRYLIHKDNTDKAQYSENERICDDYGYWHRLEISGGMSDSHKNGALAIVKDMLNGVPTMTMLERYGRDFAINRQKYYDVCRVHIAESRNKGTAWDLIQLCIQSSKFSKDEQYIFWNVLDYIRTECLLNYGVKADIVLDEAPPSEISQLPTKIVDRLS